MRRLILRLTIALLTFTIGIIAVSLWFIHHSSTVKVNRVEVAGEASDHSYFRNFYSGSMSFYQWSNYYDSPKHANKELERALK